MAVPGSTVVPGCFRTMVVLYSLVVSRLSLVGKPEQGREFLVGELVSRLQEWVVNMKVAVQSLSRMNRSLDQPGPSPGDLTVISPSSVESRPQFQAVSFQ